MTTAYPARYAAGTAGPSALGDGVKVLGAVAAGLMALGVAALLVVFALENRVIEALVEQATQLAVPADWEQVNDAVRREQFLCMSTNPCPSISRRWVTDTPVSVHDLERMATGAGLRFSVEGTCQWPPTAFSETGVCTLYGVRGEYHYQVWVSDRPQEPQQVSLEVSPNRPYLTQPRG